MTAPATRLPVDPAALAEMTIRDIVDLEPRALEILAPHGFDLCCGGGHKLGTALELHAVDPDAILPQLVSLAADRKS